MATIATSDAGAKRPWLAAILSALVPGAGQLYAGRRLRGGVWFLPIAIGAIALIPLSDLRTTDLVGAALDPEVLWGVFTVNVAAAIWRCAAAVDAFVIADDRRASDASATSLAIGWALLGLVIVAPHIVAGRYTYDAVTLVESVFVVDDEPSAGFVPLIPIGTDADIVPDPITATYDIDANDPRSSRNLVFRDHFGDPDAIDVWDDIVATRNDEPAAAPFPAFNERVGAERITILFAGGDAGPGRGGLRTDSMMVGTIDTGTGKAALFGFPRNMAQIPLPSKFRTAFVDLEKRLAPRPEPEPAPAGGGSPGGGEAAPTETTTTPPAPAFESCRCFPDQLNAIYPFTRRWSGTYPNDPDPGMAALRDVLEHLMDLEIDYYALIDMAAFVDLVDALGGIDVYVLEPLESEVSPPREGDPWAYVKVEPGWNHLDGPQALAYARARKGSSDYARMARQRCMVKAVAAQADPITVLRRFPAIVDAIEGSVVTDIPLSFVPDLIEATATLDFDDIETVGFTHAYWEPERDHRFHPIPDVDRIRSTVRRVVSGQSEPDAVLDVSTECEV